MSAPPTDSKVYWITGASSGIGEALVYELLNAQTSLVISARRIKELERVRNNCPESLRDKVRILQIDLAEADSLENKAQEAEAIFGQIDVLVNNGGVSQRDTVVNTSLAVVRQLMEVNYFAAIALSKFVLPGMIKRNSGHHVVISSSVGIISTPRRSAYAASKHALHGFYDALRAEHYKDNIAVTLVCPGYVKTNLSYKALLGDGSEQDKMDQTHLNAMSAETCAKLIARAIRQQKEEVYIGGLKEVSGVYLKRFFPGLFSKLIRKLKVT